MDARMQSYNNVILECYRVHWLYNGTAAFFSWILLAGFVVLPGAFTYLQAHGIGVEAFDLVQHTGPLCLSLVSCALGMLGTGFLCWKFRRNNLWRLQHVAM